MSWAISLLILHEKRCSSLAVYDVSLFGEGEELEIFDRLNEHLLRE